jgi:gluconate 2-dehydrogenase gamma chain
MDRREYLKRFTVGSIGAGVLLQSCGPEEKKEITEVPQTFSIDRYAAELERDKKLLSETFFDEHEMKTISVLVDIIIPKDDVSGSATDAKVPEFIEFIAKDMPKHQLPLRGGLKWLDLHCMRRFNNSFVTCTPQQQIEMIDDIAYPESVKPELQQGAAFFTLMRDLTATGFFTSKIGIADLGYAGNKPNNWDGVPQDVLDHYGVKYDERTLKESVKFDV